MALGTAVHDSECNTPESKTVTVDSDNNMIVENTEKNTG